MTTVLCVLACVVGVVGVVVPGLPGLLLCWASVAAWTLFGGPGGAGPWIALGIATGWTVTGVVVKYAWPGARLRRAGVATSTLLAGAAGAIVGMVAIPVIGLPVGFVGGVWAAETVRHANPRAAWPSTRETLAGAGLSLLVELAAALLVLATLGVAVALT